MKTLAISALLAFCIGCASTIPVCDEALKVRQQANHATGEERAMLESKAAGLESACANERERSYEQFRRMNSNGRK